MQGKTPYVQNGASCRPGSDESAVDGLRAPPAATIVLRHSPGPPAERRSWQGVTVQNRSTRSLSSRATFLRASIPIAGLRRSARWTIPGRRRSPCAASRVDGGWLVAVKIENGGVAILGDEEPPRRKAPASGPSSSFGGEEYVPAAHRVSCRVGGSCRRQGR